MAIYFRSMRWIPSLGVEMRHLRKSMASLLMVPLILGQALIAQDNRAVALSLQNAAIQNSDPAKCGNTRHVRMKRVPRSQFSRSKRFPNRGTIIHIRVEKIRLRNCTGGPEPDKFEHMPFARDAVERSVTKLVKERSVPDFQAGYDAWKNACGGVYTISVADAVQVGEDGFRTSLGCGQGG